MPADFPTGAANVVANDRIWRTDKWDRLSTSLPPNDNVEYVRINGAWRPKTYFRTGNIGSELYSPGVKFTTPPGARMALFYGQYYPTLASQLQLWSSPIIGTGCMHAGWMWCEGTYGYLAQGVQGGSRWPFYLSTFFTAGTGQPVSFQGQLAVKRSNNATRFSGWVQTFSKATASNTLNNMTHIRLDVYQSAGVCPVDTLPDITFFQSVSTPVDASTVISVEWIY